MFSPGENLQYSIPLLSDYGERIKHPQYAWRGGGGGRDGDTTSIPMAGEQKKQVVTFSVVEVPKPVLEHPKPEAHIQIRPLELPPANSQEREMQDRDKKWFGT